MTETQKKPVTGSTSETRSAISKVAENKHVTLTEWDRRDATERVTEIKTQLGYLAHNVTGTADIIREAYKNNDWQTLGYMSWEEYCDKSFHTDMMKLGSGLRKALIKELGETIGTVDLSALFGVDRKTVQRDKQDLDEGTNVPRRAAPYGDDEWNTPPEIAAAAASVMGGIDLDPASTPEANQVVKAKKFYTRTQDGMSLPWKARTVYLNPPYNRGQVGKFVTRLIREYREGNIRQAVLLVNSNTDASWFQEAAGTATAIAFPRDRLRFWRADGKEHAGATLGSAVMYFGDHPDKFRAEFIRFGFVVNI